MKKLKDFGYSCSNIDSQTIIEIGPGLGNITDEIIKKNPKKLIIIEKDNKLFQLLLKKYTNYKKQPLKFKFPTNFTGTIPVLSEMEYRPKAAVIREKGLSLIHI